MKDNMTQSEKMSRFLGIHADAEYEAWTEESARKLAKDMGIELKDEHWVVIRFLRLYYANGGATDHALEVSEALDERFEDEGGLRYLYRLFPGGPVSSGCELAGIPVPADAKSSSFGSSM